MGHPSQLREALHLPTEPSHLACTTSAARLATARNRLWDTVLRIVAHLYAGYAIDLLEHLQDDTAWKTEGLVIGSPALQLSAHSANTPSIKIGGDWVLKNQMELSADQAQILIEFLSAQEGLLKRISSYDKEDAKQALGKGYRLIAAYGGKVRERKRDRQLTENRERKVMPTSSHAAVILWFIRLHRFATPHQNRSGHGSAKANLKHSIYQD